jgi:hypothetical protein
VTVPRVVQHGLCEAPRLDQVVGAAHQRRRFDRDSGTRGEIFVGEPGEHVDRQRPDPLEVEMHVVTRQLQLLQVRPDRLGRIPRLAQRRDRRPRGALGQLLSVGADEQAVMDHLRRLRPERPVERRVQLLVGAMIGSSDHVRDLEVDVVDDRREMKRRRPVVPPQHDAVEPLGQPGLLCSGDVTRGALALAHWTVVPRDPEPAQVLDDRLLPARDVPRRVRVVEAQQQPVADATVRDRAQGIADVQRARRARREPDARRHSVATASSKWSTYSAEWRPGTRSAAAAHTTRKHVESTNESVNPVTVGYPPRTWSARNVAVN